MFIANIIDADNLVSFTHFQQNLISRSKFGEQINFCGFDGKATRCPFLLFQRNHFFCRLTNAADHISLTLAYCRTDTPGCIMPKRRLGVWSTLLTIEMIYPAGYFTFARIEVNDYDGGNESCRMILRREL
jgi:hypothetical protein